MLNNNNRIHNNVYYGKIKSIHEKKYDPFTFFIMQIINDLFFDTVVSIIDG